MQLDEIYERQHRRVYRMAMIYLKNVHDAEDAVQNVFIKYINQDITFDSLEHENAWFITVTKNYCKDVLKSFWHRNVAFVEIPDSAKEDSSNEEVLKSIMKLPKKYREVIYLYYYEEYSVKEIAILLERKESTIQTQLYDARKKIKKIMEREGM